MPPYRMRSAVRRLASNWTRVPPPTRERGSPAFQEMNEPLVPRLGTGLIWFWFNELFDLAPREPFCFSF